MKKLLTISVVALLLLKCGGENAGTSASGNPTQAAPASTPESPAPPANLIIFTANLNGAEWKGGPMSISEQYFTKGSKMLKKSEPFLQLVFVSAVEGDSRQILIYADKFSGKPGIISPDQIELNVSGKANDANKTNYFSSSVMNGVHSPVALEITKWESVSDGEALMSGKLSGKIPGSMGTPETVIENGEFNDVKIMVDVTGQ